MTQYHWNLTLGGRGDKHITLVRNEDSAEIQFYIAIPGGVAYLESHLNSLTDDHCEQWFDEKMSTEERKAKQAQRKEQAKKERAEMEANIAIQKEETARLKAAEKAAAKAKKQARQFN